MSAGRVGYFGGTFDPPHLGHVILASETRYQLGLDLINWIITPDPPHKTDRVISPQHHRMEMVQLVINQFPGFEISDVDLRRAPPHYAADTVEILKRADPNADLVYIIGEDSLRDLPDWYEPDRFLSTIDKLAVFPRPGIKIDLDRIEKALPGIGRKIHFLTGTQIQISSSVIRERAARGEAFTHFLLREVAEYIQDQNLYQK